MSELRDQIDQVADRFDSEKSKLYRENGQQLYAGAEHSERLGALRDLSSEELQRANARRALVVEDVEKLPLEELAGRMKAALASGDRAMIYLLSRSARYRVGDPKAATEADADQDGILEGEEFGEAAAAVRDLVAELDQALRPGHSQAVETARQDLETAREIQG
jgi:uncharacterized membrane protein YccC